MSAELVLAVDCSTTACKAFAWDDVGRVQAEGRVALDLDHPEPDGWQQDAEQWWRAFVGAVGQVSSALGARAQAIGALCIAHQRETFVLTDDDADPLHPALVWMDARCREQVRGAVERVGAERLHELSGKPPCTTPSLYKLLYLLEREPSLAKQRPRLLDVHGFLCWRATGRFATSLASADPLGLVEMQARRWSPELLELGGLDEAQLPELVLPGAELGRLRDEVARACGLPKGLSVIAGAGDGQAAGLGAGVTAPGRAYLNLGTAVVSGVLCGSFERDPAFRTLYGAAPDTFFMESDLKGGTFTVQWLVERWLGGQGGDEARSFETIRSELERQAAELPPGAEGLVLVPYWNGVMNPYWDDEATGVVIGWTGSHRPTHLYRAILEGIAFEQRLSLEGISAATGAIEEIVVLGGGSRSDLWCQLLADVTGHRLVRAGSAEATALGAALLAAAALGWHGGLTGAVQQMTSLGSRFEPGPQQSTYRRLYEEVYAGLFPSLQERLGRLAALRRLAAAPAGGR